MMAAIVRRITVGVTKRRSPLAESFPDSSSVHSDVIQTKRRIQLRLWV
jgi:hypothetical protein